MRLCAQRLTLEEGKWGRGREVVRKRRLAHHNTARLAWKIHQTKSKGEKKDIKGQEGFGWMPSGAVQTL